MLFSASMKNGSFFRVPWMSVGFFKKCTFRVAYSYHTACSRGGREVRVRVHGSGCVLFMQSTDTTGERNYHRWRMPAEAPTPIPTPTVVTGSISGSCFEGAIR